MSNLIRRKNFTTAGPPDPDAIDIGEGEIAYSLIAAHLPHIHPPHCTFADLAKLKAQIFMAAAIKLAIGGGAPAWDDTPVDSVAGLTALVDFIGEFVTACQYVTVDPSGAIQTAAGTKYSHSSSPTNRIYIEATYASSDEADAVIRELGVYMNATPSTGHSGDNYLPAANLDDIGTFIAEDRIAYVERSASTSGKIKVVLKIGNSA